MSNFGDASLAQRNPCKSYCCLPLILQLCFEIWSKSDHTETEQLHGEYPYSYHFSWTDLSAHPLLLMKPELWLKLLSRAWLFSHLTSNAPQIQKDITHNICCPFQSPHIVCREEESQSALGTAFYKLVFATREIYFCWIRISVTNPKCMCFTNHDLH